MKNQWDDYEWERGSVLKLYQEYRSVLWQQRLTLRPVAIQLFDSNSHWGNWDPLTRTISIAKKLILNHSWFYVQAILRHEMAHQLVDEMYGLSADKPHGAHFHWACERLGVPEEFKKASVQFQETPLDWRTEKCDEGTEKLLDKVQKLLALATSSNEHEALLAMNKVRELYAKHNLEQAAEAKKTQFAHIVICHRKKRIEPHQSRIVSILVGHFFVRVLTCNLFEAKSGEDHRAIEIIGTRENAVMAEYVYHFLLQQSDFWVREAVKTSKRKLSPVERKSFRLGILAGFSEKLAQSERAKTSESAEPTSTSRTGTELTLIGKAVQKFKKDPRLDSYMGKVYPRITRSAASYQNVDDDAYGAGKIVGKSITLNKAVTTEDGNRGRLLE